MATYRGSRASTSWSVASPTLPRIRHPLSAIRIFVPFLLHVGILPINELDRLATRQNAIVNQAALPIFTVAPAKGLLQGGTR